MSNKSLKILSTATVVSTVGIVSYTMGASATQQLKTSAAYVRAMNDDAMALRRLGVYTENNVTRAGSILFDEANSQMYDNYANAAIYEDAHGQVLTPVNTGAAINHAIATKRAAVAKMPNGGIFVGQFNAVTPTNLIDQMIYTLDENMVLTTKPMVSFTKPAAGTIQMGNLFHRAAEPNATKGSRFSAISYIGNGRYAIGGGEETNTIKNKGKFTVIEDRLTNSSLSDDNAAQRWKINEAFENRNSNKTITPGYIHTGKSVPTAFLKHEEEDGFFVLTPEGKGNGVSFYDMKHQEWTNLPGILKGQNGLPIQSNPPEGVISCNPQHLFGDYYLIPEAFSQATVIKAYRDPVTDRIVSNPADSIYIDTRNLVPGQGNVPTAPLSRPNYGDIIVDHPDQNTTVAYISGVSTVAQGTGKPDTYLIKITFDTSNPSNITFNITSRIVFETNDSQNYAANSAGRYTGITALDKDWLFFWDSLGRGAKISKDTLQYENRISETNTQKVNSINDAPWWDGFNLYSNKAPRGASVLSVKPDGTGAIDVDYAGGYRAKMDKYGRFINVKSSVRPKSDYNTFAPLTTNEWPLAGRDLFAGKTFAPGTKKVFNVHSTHSNVAEDPTIAGKVNTPRPHYWAVSNKDTANKVYIQRHGVNFVPSAVAAHNATIVLDADEHVTSTNILKVKPTNNPAATTFVVSDDVMFIGTNKGRIKAYKLNSGAVASGGEISDVTNTYIDTIAHPGGIVTPGKPITSFAKDDIAKQNIAPQFTGISTNPDVTQPSSFGTILFAAGNELYKFSPVVDIDNNITVAKKPYLLKPIGNTSSGTVSNGWDENTKIVDIINVGGNVAGDHYPSIMSSYTHIAVAENGSAWGFNSIGNDLTAASYNYDFRNKVDYEPKFGGNDVLKVHDAGEGNYFLQGPNGLLQKVSTMYNGKSGKVMGIEPEWSSTNSAPKKIAGIDGNILSIANMPNNTFIIGSDAGKIYKMDSTGTIIEITNGMNEKTVPGFTETSTVDQIISDRQGCYFAIDYTTGKVANINQKGERQFYKAGGETRAETEKRWMLFNSPQIAFNAKPYLNTLWFQGAGGDASAQHIVLPNGVELRWKRWNDSDNNKEDPTEENGWSSSLEHMQVMNGDAIRARLVVTNDAIFPYSLNDPLKNQEKIIIKGLAQPAETHTTAEIFGLSGISFSGLIEESVQIHFAPTPSSISFDFASKGLKVQYWDSALRVWQDNFNFKTTWKNGDELKMRLVALPNYNSANFAISDINAEYTTTITGADKKVYNLETFVERMTFTGNSGQPSRYITDTPLSSEIELWYGFEPDPDNFTKWNEGQAIPLWNDQMIYFQFKELNASDPIHQANYEVINNETFKYGIVHGLNKTNISLSSFMNGLEVQGDLQADFSEWTKLVEKNPLPKIITPTENGLNTEQNDVAVVLTYIIFTAEGNMIETTNWADIRTKIKNGDSIIIVAQFDSARGEEQSKHYNLINASITKVVSPWFVYDMSNFWAQGYFEGNAMTYGNASYRNRSTFLNNSWENLIDIHAQSGGRWVDIKTVSRLWRNEDPDNTGAPREFVYLKAVPKNIGQPGGFPSNVKLIRNEEYNPGDKNGYRHIIRNLSKKVMDVDSLWKSIIDTMTYSGRASTDITINYTKPQVPYSYNSSGNPSAFVDVDLLISTVDSPSGTNPGHWRKIEPNVKTYIGLLNTKNAHFMWSVDGLTAPITFSFGANYSFINNNIISKTISGLQLYTLANPVESAGGNFVKQSNFTFERHNRNTKEVTITLGGLYVSPGNPYYYIYSTTPNGTFTRNYPTELENGQILYVKVIGDPDLGFDIDNKVFADVVHQIVVRNLPTEYINVTTFIQMLEIDPTKFAYSGSFLNLDVEADESAKGQSIKLEFSIDDVVWYSETDTHFGEPGHFLSRLYNGQVLKVRAAIKDYNKFDQTNYSFQNNLPVTYVVSGLQKITLDLTEQTDKITADNFSGQVNDATFTSVDDEDFAKWKSNGILLQMDIGDGRGFITLSDTERVTRNIDVTNADTALFRMTAGATFDRNNFIFGVNTDKEITISGLEKRHFDFTNLWPTLVFGRNEDGVFVTYDESYIQPGSNIIVKYKINGTGTEFELDLETDRIDESFTDGDFIEFNVVAGEGFDTNSNEIINGSYTTASIDTPVVALDILKIFQEDFESNPSMPFISVSGSAGNADVRFDYQVLQTRIISKILETYEGLDESTFRLDVQYSVNGKPFTPLTSSVTLDRKLYNRDIITFKFNFDPASSLEYTPIKNTHNIILGSKPETTLNKIRVDIKSLVESRNFITFKTSTIAGTSSTNNVIVLKNFIDRHLVEFSHSTDDITWSSYMRLTELEKTIDGLKNGDSFKLRVTRQNSLYNKANYAMIRADGTEIIADETDTSTQYEYQSSYKVSGLDKRKADFTDLIRSSVSMERVKDETSEDWFVNLVFTEAIYSKMVAEKAKFAFATGTQQTSPDFSTWIQITTEQLAAGSTNGIYKYKLETIDSRVAFTSRYLNKVNTNMTVLPVAEEEDPNNEIFVSGKFLVAQVSNLAKVKVDVKPYLSGISATGKAFHGTFINNEKTLLPSLVGNSVTVKYKLNENDSWPSGETPPQTLKNGDIWFIRVSPSGNFMSDDIELVGNTLGAVTIVKVVTGLTKETINVNDSFNPDRSQVYWTGNTFSNALSTSPNAFTNATRPKPSGVIYTYSNNGVDYSPSFPILDNSQTLYIKYFAHTNSVNDWNYQLEGVFEYEVNNLNKILLNPSDDTNNPEGSIWKERRIEGSTGNGILLFNSPDLLTYSIDIEYRLFRPSEGDVWGNWTLVQNNVITGLRNGDKLEMRLIPSANFDANNYDILNKTFNLEPITTLTKITIDYSVYSNVRVTGFPYDAHFTAPPITDPNHRELLNGILEFQIDPTNPNSDPWTVNFPGSKIKNGTTIGIRWVPKSSFDSANYEVVNNLFTYTVSSLQQIDIAISSFNITIDGSTMSPRINIEYVNNEALQKMGIITQYQLEGNNHWTTFRINEPIPNADFENGERIRIRFTESENFDYENYLLLDSIKQMTLRNLIESYNFTTLVWNSAIVSGNAYEGVLAINDAPAGFVAEFNLNSSDEWVPSNKMYGLKNGDIIRVRIVIIDARLKEMIDRGELLVENTEFTINVTGLVKRDIYISSATEQTFEFSGAWNNATNSYDPGVYGDIRLNHRLNDAGAVGKVRLGYRKYSDIPVNENGEFLDPEGNVIPIIDENGNVTYDLLNEIYPFTLFDENNKLPDDFWIMDRIEVMFIPVDGYDPLNDGRVLSMQGQIWDKHMGIDPMDRLQVEKVKTLQFNQKEWFVNNPEAFVVKRTPTGIVVEDNITPHAVKTNQATALPEHLWRFLQLQFYSSSQNDWVNYDSESFINEVQNRNSYQLRFVYDELHAEIELNTESDDNGVIEIEHAINVIGDPVTLQVDNGDSNDKKSSVWGIVGGVIGGVLTLGLIVGIILFIKKKNKDLEKQKAKQTEITSDKSE